MREFISSSLLVTPASLLLCSMEKSISKLNTWKIIIKRRYWDSGIYSNQVSFVLLLQKDIIYCSQLQVKHLWILIIFRQHWVKELPNASTICLKIFIHKINLKSPFLWCLKMRRIQLWDVALKIVGTGNYLSPGAEQGERWSAFSPSIIFSGGNFIYMPIPLLSICFNSRKWIPGCVVIFCKRCLSLQDTSSPLRINRRRLWTFCLSRFSLISNNKLWYSMTDMLQRFRTFSS